MTEETTVHKMHLWLQSKIKFLDNQLISQLSPTIDRIQQIRYNRFTDCVNHSKNIPQCYKQSLQLELRLDFQSHSNTLQQCLSSVSSNNSWQKPTNQCFEKYEKSLRKALNTEVSRILKHLNL